MGADPSATVVARGVSKGSPRGRLVACWDIADHPVRLLTATNFARAAARLRLPAALPRRARLLFSTDPDRAGGDADLERFVVLPGEAVLLLLDAAPAAAA
jgi:hypothetical protein